VGWGGGRCNRGGDRLQDAVLIGHNIVIVEAKNSITFSAEKRVTAHIALLLLSLKMLAAIELNDEL
jgi:hypothetical protein